MLQKKPIERIIPEVNIIDAPDDQIEEEYWMKIIMDYLERLILPKDKVKARKFRLRAERFAMIEGVLFRKSFSGPFLRCVLREEIKIVL